MPRILAIPAFADNYIWALIDQKNKQMAVVDPGDASPVQTFLDNHELTLTDILITHHHPDHTGGVSDLLTQWPECRVYGPDTTSSFATTVCEEDHTFPLFKEMVTVIHTPGHTLDHLCYLHPHGLFCGDTLFSGGCGRLFEGTPDMMHASLAKLYGLPGATPVYCAHEYTLTNMRFAAHCFPHHEPTQSRLKDIESLRKNNAITLPSSIALEREINPFLRVFNDYDTARLCNDMDLPHSTSSVELFAAIRHAKDQF